MTIIVPFKGEFCGEVQTIYMVNNDNPKSFISSVTTSEKCPHCEKRHVYRVYDHKSERTEEGWLIEIYDCKCPSCHQEFDLEVEHKL